MTTTMIISNLPMDMLIVILSRVPLTSMRAIRLTCKNWNDLSKSESLMKMRIDQAAAKEGECQMIVMMDNNLYLTSILLNGDPSAEHIGKLTCLDEQVKLSRIFPCEGILLCILKGDSKFVVWNPYLGQTRWIKPICHRLLDDVLEMFGYALGYGNKESCRSYKLLRFRLSYHKVPRKQLFWYEIYDFESDSWTTHDVTSPHWHIAYGKCGLSFKGNAYFCASKRNAKEGRNRGRNDHIILFDFTSERFGPLLRLPFNAGCSDSVNLSCVREEKLAVLVQHNNTVLHEYDFWITTKIESEEVSWIKFLRFGSHVPFPDITRCNFYIDEEKKVAIGFDDDMHRHTISIIGEAGYFRTLDLVGEFGGQLCNSHVYSYIPSLVQFKQPVCY